MTEYERGFIDKFAEVMGKYADADDIRNMAVGGIELVNAMGGVPGWGFGANDQPDNSAALRRYVSDKWNNLKSAARTAWGYVRGAAKGNWGTCDMGATKHRGWAARMADMAVRRNQAAAPTAVAATAPAAKGTAAPTAPVAAKPAAASATPAVPSTANQTAGAKPVTATPNI